MEKLNIFIALTRIQAVSKVAPLSLLPGAEAADLVDAMALGAAGSQ